MDCSTDYCQSDVVKLASETCKSSEEKARTTRETFPRENGKSCIATASILVSVVLPTLKKSSAIGAKI